MLKSLLSGDVMAEAHGTGPAGVIALHGWGRDRSDWLTTLRGGPSAIALDLPGFGLSKPPPQPWDTHDYAHLLAPIAVASPRPRLLVGHSFGARIAIRLAAANPEQFDGLILTGAPLIRLTQRLSPARPYRILRTLHRHGLLNERQMDRARFRYGSKDYRTSEGVMRQTLVRVINEDYTEDIRKIDQYHLPLLLVWGAQDTTTPIEIARTLVERHSNAQLLVAEGSAHGLDSHLSGEISRAIAEWYPGSYNRPLRHHYWEEQG